MPPSCQLPLAFHWAISFTPHKPMARAHPLLFRRKSTRWERDLTTRSPSDPWSTGEMGPVSILTSSAYSWVLGILNSCRSWQDSPRYRQTFCTQNTIAQASSHRGTEDTCSPTLRDALGQLPGLPCSMPTSQNTGKPAGLGQH